MQEFSFAAHVDGQENREFIEEIAAPIVVREVLVEPCTAHALTPSADFGPW